VSDEAVIREARERLRRAAEDGERLYRMRMHDEPTIADDNRIDGILTRELSDALGFADRLVARLEAAERQRDAARIQAKTNEEWARTMEHERDWERDVVHCELLNRADTAEAALADARVALQGLSDAATTVWHRASIGTGIVDVPALDALLEAIATTRAALAAAGETAAPMQFAWLVERGQSEKHSPTVWWIGGPDTTNRSGESWTQDAFKATRFARRDDAQEIVDRLFTHRGEPTARAVEHGFASASAAGETAPSEPLRCPECGEALALGHDCLAGGGAG
jgi:hypothetical protein